MKLSIVIINWNTKSMLHDCLESVFDNLGGLNAEVIVVDNASDDCSPDMVEHDFPDTVLVRNTKNHGFAAANNQALEIATGEYLLLLNSDTIVLGDVLQRSVHFMEGNPEAGMMGCRVLNTDRTMQPTCSMFPSLLNLMLLSSGLWKLPWPPFFDRYQMRRWDRRDEREVDVISGCYLMVRKSAMDQVGLLDENFFFFGEETDWCTRFKKAGWDLRFAPVGEIIHHGSVSARKLNYRRDLLLSNGLVRLHRKHNGQLMAALVWTVLFLFNLSRACYWSARSTLSRSETVLERRRHFVNIVRYFGQAWTSVEVAR